MSVRVVDLPARDCPKCNMPAETKRIQTDLPGSSAVVMSRCLCDMRRCSYKDCMGYTRDPRTPRCSHCKRVF